MGDISVQKLDKWIEQLSDGKLLTLSQIKRLCDTAKKILYKEPNLIKVKSPTNVVGDVRGHLSDLILIFKIGGDVRHSDVNYVFLGGYVDSGHYSVETLSLLIAYKVRCREKICILRGHHESTDISRSFEFSEQCMQKYRNHRVYDWFIKIFKYLPLAALVDGQVFCVHGGISPSMRDINFINKLVRYRDIPNAGPLCDFIWADPHDGKGWKKFSNKRGYSYGYDISRTFSSVNEIKLICRGHEMVMEGYERRHDACVVTIFSAPNYQGSGNKGAILRLCPKSEPLFFIFTPGPSLGQHCESVDEFPKVVLRARRATTSPPQSSTSTSRGTRTSASNVRDVELAQADSGTRISKTWFSSLLGGGEGASAEERNS